MFGTISAFFHKYLAGVIPTESGWRHVSVAPSFGELCTHKYESELPRGEARLGAVQDTLQSATGEWRVSWYLDVVTGDATLNVTVPALATATVVVPCACATGVAITETISGVIVWLGGRSKEAKTNAIRTGRCTKLGGASFDVLGGHQYAFLRQTL